MGIRRVRGERKREWQWVGQWMEEKNRQQGRGREGGRERGIEIDVGMYGTDGKREVERDRALWKIKSFAGWLGETVGRMVTP